MTPSPCVDICRIEDGLCVGCLRRIDEIAAWPDADENRKQGILAAVAQRRRRAEAELAGNCRD